MAIDITRQAIMARSGWHGRGTSDRALPHLLIPSSVTLAALLALLLHFPLAADPLPEIEGLTPVQQALRQAMDQDRSFSRNRQGTPGYALLSQQGAIEAYQRFLREHGEKATPQEHIFVNWRIGCLYAYNYDSGLGEGPNFDKARPALIAALDEDPKIISGETRNAATVLATLSLDPVQRARDHVRAYTWLATRTDEHVARSAQIIQSPSNLIIDPILRPGSRGDRTLEERERNVQRWLKEDLGVVETQIGADLRRSRHPEGVRTLLEGLEKVAPAEKMKTWRALAFDHQTEVDRMLEQGVRDLEASPPAEVQMPALEAEEVVAPASAPEPVAAKPEPAVSAAQASDEAGPETAWPWLALGLAAAVGVVAAGGLWWRRVRRGQA